MASVKIEGICSVKRLPGCKPRLRMWRLLLVACDATEAEPQAVVIIQLHVSLSHFSHSSLTYL